MSAQDDKLQPDTLAIRGGYQRSHENEHSEALFLTSSYVFENAEMAAASILAMSLRAMFTPVTPIQPYALLKSDWQHWKRASRR